MLTHVHKYIVYIASTLPKAAPRYLIYSPNPGFRMETRLHNIRQGPVSGLNVNKWFLQVKTTISRVTEA